LDSRQLPYQAHYAISLRISRTVRGDDDLAAFAELGLDFAQRAAGEVEGDEEAFGAILARHHGLERVNIRAADLILLFDLPQWKGKEGFGQGIPR